jgi:hypothetical protein
MSNDPIVEEIRAIRHEQFQKFNGDIAAMCDDLRNRERQSSRERITFTGVESIGVITSLPTPEVGSSPATLQ